MKKYIFVTGGVCSSLGKGIAAASLGSLLESRGHSIRMIKIDPYINVDAGTMSPFQHGEVYVTDDGAETDLDLGNYARFTSSPLDQYHSITTGQIYDSVIRKERQGKYLGKCVQVVPHITDEIKRRIRQIGHKDEVDVTIVEVGGTVGDIESIPYLEAVRQMIHEQGHKDALSVHLTLVPTVGSGEVKTKPTQHSVKEMREIGIQPDVLLCRCEKPLNHDLRKKISLFTNIDYDAVLSAHDVLGSIYEIPILYHKQGLDNVVVEKMGLSKRKAKLSEWELVADNFSQADRSITIAMVGKYIDLEDAYKSVDEAIIHGAISNKCRVEIKKIDSEQLEGQEDLSSWFEGVDGILIPGGFGQRGIQGMIETVRYARENKIPCFGICLGMQVMVIEFCRNVLGYEDADSTEFEPDTRHPVITLLEEQVDITNYGGTMRLGLSSSRVNRHSMLWDIYGKHEVIHERHRHRYEVSNQYRKEMQENGILIAATTPDEALVESIQWENHPWGVGVQYHPEFKSRPVEPNPLFHSFIKISKEKSRES